MIRLGLKPCKDEDEALNEFGKAIAARAGDWAGNKDGGGKDRAGAVMVMSVWMRMGMCVNWDENSNAVAGDWDETHSEVGKAEAGKGDGFRA